MVRFAAGVLIGWMAFGINPVNGFSAQNTSPRYEGTITMSGAFALYPMAVKWTEEFRKIHPEVRLDIGAGGAGKGMTDALTTAVDIGMVSRDIYPEEIQRGAWYVAVTKDAVVPTLNAKNPLVNSIVQQGITKEKARNIWVTEEITTWNDFLDEEPKTKQMLPIRLFTRSDACGAAKTWAKYFGASQEDLTGVGVYADPGVANAVQKEPLGIGYNNINYAYDMNSGEPFPGLRVLPLDLNENGSIDPDEQFYGHRSTLLNAIADGVYPSPPARDLYFVSQGVPERPVVREFIRWVLTDGQQYVPESGYIRLPESQLREQLGKLK